MNHFQSLFSDKYLHAQFKQLELPETEVLNQKLNCLARWKKSLINKSIEQSKEESLQGDFLQQFFVTILDYSNQKDSGAWTLETEQKTLDNKKMDGALGFFKVENNALIADVRVVIELKNAKTDLDKPQNRKEDKRTPIQQAFDYANTLGGSCRWIIVSNFKEIRLYKQGDRTTYQAFDILTLDNIEKFKTFYFLLNKKRLIAQTGESITDKLFIEQQEEKLAISKRFYADYKQARFDIFHRLKADFPAKSPLLLLNKTQKLLDRLIFIRFCESNAIIASDTLKGLIELVKKDKFLRDKNKLFKRLHVFFAAIDKGDEPLAINKFNGGLFKEDGDFNELMTEDALLEPVLKLVDYDFKSDLDVNILGHIFEQSLSDIEELKAEISGEVLDKKQSKRKKDGIYYTPDYITKYIVEEAIGGWLKERRGELNAAALPELSEEDWHSISYITKGKEKGTVKWNAAIQTHIDFYQAYQKILSHIKVLDPACGSGAFLNQAFDFLYAEGVRVNQRLAELMYPAEASQLNILKLNEKLEQHILNDNLFGVDLNEESVEITRLSLWIKTANRRDELTTLDDNIKCGNSLIDDVAMAGEKAFVWEKEFKAIMENGGFDVVIGNPPYATGTVLPQIEKEFYLSKFSTAQYQLELYVLFIEKAIFLLAKGGNIAFITPNSWLKNLMMSACRQLMLANLSFKKIIPNIPTVFNDASVDTLIFTACKETIENNCIQIRHSIDKSSGVTHTVEQNRLLGNHKYIFDLEVNDNLHVIFDKLNGDCIAVADLFYISRGINPYDKYTGQIESIIQTKAYHADYKKDDSFVPELRGKHIARYYYEWDKKHYISYGSWLAAPREERFFKGERIVFREVLGKTNFVCTLITEDIKIDRSLYIALPRENSSLYIKYILAVLSSKLLSFYFRHKNNEFDALFPKIRIAEFNRLPIKNISKEQQVTFIEKVNIMLSENKNLQTQITAFLNFITAEFKPQKISTKLHRYYELDWTEFKAELKKAKVDLDKKFDLKKRREWQAEFESEKQKALAIKNIIDQTDNEIDNMVYALYGLNDNDIAIINQDG